TLQVIGAKDLVGNVAATQSADFQFILIEPIAEFDLLINEIMAAPTLNGGLPPVEWVEIYNRSTKTIELNGLRFDDGGTPHPLSAYLLAPQDYIVLTATGDVSTLTPITPKVLGVVSFPSLNNAGDVLTLSTAAGMIIDRVAYTDNWHTESFKKAGGWSLERVNPNLPCIGRENWVSTRNPPGGTPGKQNDTLQTTSDQTAPRLLAAFPETPTMIRLTFSEGLDQLTAETPGAYQLMPARNISAAAVPSDDRSAVIITLDEPLQIGVIYTVQVNQMVEDCSGNTVIANSSVLTGLPEKPDFQDIVINEILFNPASFGAEYIEFYNRSQKIFGWPEFFLTGAGSAGTQPITAKRVILPGDYAVFTTDTADISHRFANVRSEALYQNNLPSLPDDESTVGIYWVKNGQVVWLDSLHYREEWHNALFSSSERNGVALERIRSEQPTNLASNWTSAAAPITGGAAGTPTQPNSQQITTGSPTDELIFLPVARLSPDNDGFEDFLDIHYTLPGAGFSATMTIFDSDGVPVNRLVRQQLIGTQGQLRWDGDMEDGNRARPGIYILYLELFSPN
ncbi:MAG: lamin tail domain-containing protein, partial [Saprospiraceae bacterium]